MTRSDAADTMPQIDPVHTTAALHRPLPNREYNPVPLPEGHHLSARLHAGALFRYHELSTRKVSPGV